MSPALRALAFGLAVPACGAPAAPPVSRAAPPPAASPAPSPAASPPLATAPSRAGTACGALECRLFDAPADAFAAVLAHDPVVLGVGEAHAQKATEGVASVTRRFTAELLPQLQGRASDLIVELMIPPKGCKPEVEQKVRAEQKQVTAPQADGNQAEYVALGEAARAIGVVPDGLRPSCADLDDVAKAGADAVPRMLDMIARLSAAKAKQLFDRDAVVSPEKLVVVYGGAMHNDLAPRAGREGFSFGPALAGVTGDRYLELDVFVPESIQDTETWRSFAWYPHYDRAAHGSKTALFRVGPRSFVLLFPRSATPASAR